jgi:hypothetical protein
MATNPSGSIPKHKIVTPFPKEASKGDTVYQLEVAEKTLRLPPDVLRHLLEILVNVRRELLYHPELTEVQQAMARDTYFDS